MFSRLNQLIEDHLEGILAIAVLLAVLILTGLGNYYIDGLGV